MKKVLISIFVIILTVGVVSGSAFAVFSNKVQVSGLTLSSGNADLKIGLTDSADVIGSGCDSYGTSGTLCDAITDYQDIDGMYPGFIVGDYFRLKNMSDAEVSLDVTAALKSYANSSGYPGSWNELKDAVEARVLEYNSPSDALWAYSNQDVNWSKVSNPMSWQSLDWWSTEEPTITSSSLAPDQERHFVLWIRVLESAGNNIADKSVDLDMEITGTQSI